MAKIRFKRVAEAFDHDVALALARIRVCESSGSEHSPQESSMDLSDLVKSFIERETRGNGENDDVNCDREIKDRPESESDCSDSELKDTMRELLLLGCGDDEIKKKIYAETEKAYRVIGNGPSPDFKRRLMTRLRDRGFDAGLCKSKWERIGRFPSGSYEYIDVNISKTRYIIEVSLSHEFEIARPTESYSSLLDVLPPIFVGKVEELKGVVRLMCNGIKDSMKHVDMHVPPWRRHRYMQEKWFGSYKRTTNEVPTKKEDSESDSDLAGKRSVGFVPLPVAISYHCREDYGSKAGGLKVGKLAMELL